MDIEILLSSLAAGVIGYVAFFLLSFFLSFLIAPFCIYRDDQERIADLENQLDRPLDLHVTVPRVFAMDPGAFRNLQWSEDGLVIFLQDIRFTNRSVTHNVSLNLTLMISGRGGDYQVGEEKVSWIMPPENLISSPIGIGPGMTESGDVYFLVSPETVRKCGGKWKLNYYNYCRLVICDVVSGKKMDKDISQEALASQQSMRDTPVWRNEE
jgi:hypothetical protein